MYLRVFTIAQLALNLFAVWIKNKQKSFAYSSRCKTHAGGTGVGALAIIALSDFNSCKAAYPNFYYFIVRFACFHGCILDEQRDFIRLFLVY
jgi:hypothetical protein